MLDIEVSPEVADAIAEIGRVDPRYHSPEGVLFRKALALIAEEKNWFRGFQGGGMSDCQSGQLCSIIALDHAYGGTIGSYGHTAVYKALRASMSPGSIVTFNATHTHAEVIAKWHEAGHANGWL